jgi:hypothetical protein
VSEYQGLNLPELLELLEPIVLPEPVSLLPQTPGWWVLAGWLLTLALIAIWQRRRRWQANRYRRQAQAEIDALLSDCAPTSAAIAAVVKRTALAVYPRSQVASLTGSEWAAFLEHSCDGDPEVAASAQQLALAAYRPDIDPDSIVESARRWIECHRV